MLIKVDVVNIQGVNAIPIAAGIQLWKTNAPVMLDIDKVSLDCPVQITLLKHSGNSVAIGDNNKLIIIGCIFKIFEKYIISFTKKCADIISKSSENIIWENINK